MTHTELKKTVIEFARFIVNELDAKATSDGRLGPDDMDGWIDEFLETTTLKTFGV